MTEQKKIPWKRNLQKYASISVLGIGSIIAFAGFAQSRVITKIATAQGNTATKLLAVPLSPNGSTAYYDAQAALSLSSTPLQLERARRAAAEVILREPQNLTAWNRLVFIDVSRNGNLTKEGVAAFIKSYEISPYGDVSDMIWRVDLASQFWTSLPDSLQTKTLAQIPVIGRFGISWPWRIRHCKTNQHLVLHDAICAIAPNVDRAAPLEEKLEKQL